MKHLTRKDLKLGQAFTLIEMVVVVIIVAVLAAIASVGYSGYVDAARDAKVKAQLKIFVDQANAYAAANDITGELTFPMYQGALDVFPDVVSTGTTAGGAGWSVVPGDTAPATEYEFSVAFDNGMGTSMNPGDGTRASVVTRSPTGRFFAEIMLARPGAQEDDPEPFPVPVGATAADVLAGAVWKDAKLPYPKAPEGEVDSGAGTGGVGADPVTNPVFTTPNPDTNWLTCTPAGPATGGPVATVTGSQIVTHGDSAVWWEMDGDTAEVTGYKICVRSGGGYELLASTGAGTADARTWVVRTNESHPNVHVYVITVLENGTEYLSTNSCETKPAGGAKGWPKQPRGC